MGCRTTITRTAAEPSASSVVARLDRATHRVSGSVRRRLRRGIYRASRTPQISDATPSNNEQEPMTCANAMWVKTAAMAAIKPPSRHMSPQPEEAKHSNHNNHEANDIDDVAHTRISLFWRNASQTGSETHRVLLPLLQQPVSDVKALAAAAPALLVRVGECEAR